MYLLITEYTYKGEKYRHAKIVEGYRDGKKVKHKVLMNIGRIETEEDEKRARELLEALKKGDKPILLKELKIGKIKEFGLIYAAERYLKKIGIEELIKEIFKKEKKQFDLYEVLLYAGINRLYKPGSDNNFVEWLKEVWIDEKIESHQVYRMLDVVEKRKEEIEKGIFRLLKKNKEIETDIVFYDLTSTYFESSSSDLAKCGYSRCHRPDRKQIVIGVVLCDGLPIAHYVFEGNTVDKKTLKQTLKDLKKRFKLKNIVFVADRGIITVDNLKELEQNDYDYILATKRRNEKLVRKLMTKPIESKDGICVKEVYKEGNKRYILCLNKEVREVELKRLKELRKNLEKFLVENKDKKDLKIRTYKKFGKATKFIDFKNCKIDEEVWRYERKIAGRYLLVTTTKMEEREVLERYKELKEVENFFRDLKHVVDVRPIYHQKDERIKAHVFVCVFSLLIERLLERKIGRKEIERLKKIKCVELRHTEEKVTMLQELGACVNSFKKLGIEIPTKFLQ